MGEGPARWRMDEILHHLYLGVSKLSGLWGQIRPASSDSQCSQGSTKYDQDMFQKRCKFSPPSRHCCRDQTSHLLQTSTETIAAILQRPVRLRSSMRINTQEICAGKRSTPQVTEFTAIDGDYKLHLAFSCLEHTARLVLQHFDGVS